MSHSDTFDNPLSLNGPADADRPNASVFPLPDSGRPRPQQHRLRRPAATCQHRRPARAAADGDVHAPDSAGFPACGFTELSSSAIPSAVPPLFATHHAFPQEPSCAKASQNSVDKCLPQAQSPRKQKDLGRENSTQMLLVCIPRCRESDEILGEGSFSEGYLASALGGEASAC